MERCARVPDVTRDPRVYRSAEPIAARRADWSHRDHRRARDTDCCARAGRRTTATACRGRHRGARSAVLMVERIDCTDSIAHRCTESVSRDIPAACRDARVQRRLVARRWARTHDSHAGPHAVRSTSAPQVPTAPRQCPRAAVRRSVALSAWTGRAVREPERDTPDRRGVHRSNGDSEMRRWTLDHQVRPTGHHDAARC